VALGVNADGRRELLGLKVGDSEGFWSEFLVSLKQRGLSGVKLVISDAHVGLTKAIRRQLPGAALQLTRALCPQSAAACPQGSPGHGHGCVAQRVCPGER